MMVISLILIAPWLAILGASCIAVPILIHLLSRRRRPPIDWAAMRFVIEAWKTRRRRLQIQNILLLCIRCLIPILLGLALAQPILSGRSIFTSSGKMIHIIIDNSMVSGYPDDSGEAAFERHRSRALDIIDRAQQGDEIGVIPLSMIDQRHSIPHQRDHSMVMSGIRKMQPTAGQADLERALREVSRIVSGDQSRPHQVILLSDFREGSGRIDEALPSDLLASKNVQLDYSPPSTDVVEQTRIMDVTPLRRLALRDGGVESLASQSLVHLERDGEQLPATTNTLKATTPDGATTSRQVNWDAGSRTMIVDLLLPVTTGETGDSSIKVTVGEDLPAQQHHVLVELQDVLRIIILDRDRLGRDSLPIELDSSNWIQRALQPSDELPIDVRRVDPASLVEGDLMDIDAVFILRPDLLEVDGWDLLSIFQDDGGLIMVLPPGERNIHNWTDRMNTAFDLDWRFDQETKDLDAKEGLEFSETDDSVLAIISPELPTLLEPIDVSRILGMDPGMDSTTLLRTDSGIPFLVMNSNPGSGTLLFMASSPRLDWTNLPAKPLMVPLIQESLRGGLHLGRDQQDLMVGLSVEAHDHLLKSGELRHPDGTSIFLSDVNGMIDRPGTWSFLGSNGLRKGRYTANVDPSSGDMDIQTQDAVDTWLSETGEWTLVNESESTDEAGYSLVWLLLGILAALVLVESFLSRLFSPSVGISKGSTTVMGTAS